MERLRTLVLPLFPLLIFLSLSGLVSQGVLPNPILFLRVDLAALAALVGFVLAALVALGLLLWGWWAGRVRRETAVQMRVQAAEDRRRFLRRLDHELKNPLTAIRAGLANLGEASNLAFRREALTSVEAETLRLSRLTADLRKLAELETRPLERGPVHLAELLQEALGLAQEQPQARTRHLTLTLPQAPWPLPLVSGDWDLLFLAVYNLLDNALKFTQSGDTVEVRAFEDGATVVLEVADTGPGIPEAELPHVWEELYRGQGARGIRGSGLGLALVQAIVERHGGQTNLRSRAGQGTVVTLRLPVG
jgi:two-component system OmpR family sensor kinase